MKLKLIAEIKFEQHYTFNLTASIDVEGIEEKRENEKQKEKNEFKEP